MAATTSLLGVATSLVPPIDDDDNRLHRLVIDCLDRGCYAGSVSRAWATGPQAWVITVQPVNADAATLTVWIREADLQLAVGHSYVEICATEQGWDLVERLVRAVFAGDVKEGGWGSDRFVRADTPSGSFTFGRVHLPLPWRWRRTHRFARYEARST